jgi:hypothetical protein
MSERVSRVVLTERCAPISRHSQSPSACLNGAARLARSSTGPPGRRAAARAFAGARGFWRALVYYNNSFSKSNSVYDVRVWWGQATMTYTIHASKNGQTSVTVRINPATAVDKARVLELLGWQVHVTDSAGHLFTPLDFDRL